jgi:hypothetical protein
MCDGLVLAKPTIINITATSKISLFKHHPHEYISNIDGKPIQRIEAFISTKHEFFCISGAK